MKQPRVRRTRPKQHPGASAHSADLRSCCMSPSSIRYPVKPQENRRNAPETAAETTAGSKGRVGQIRSECDRGCNQPVHLLGGILPPMRAADDSADSQTGNRRHDSNVCSPLCRICVESVVSVAAVNPLRGLCGVCLSFAFCFAVSFCSLCRGGLRGESCDCVCQ